MLFMILKMIAFCNYNTINTRFDISLYASLCNIDSFCINDNCKVTQDLTHDPRRMLTHKTRHRARRVESLFKNNGDVYITVYQY